MHGLPFGVDSSQTAISPIPSIQQTRWRELNQGLRRLTLAREPEVVLLVVNPEVLHVYWHVDSPRALSLRLHDLVALDVSGCNPHHCFDWRLLKQTGKAYLRLPGGNRHVMVEIGELQAYRRLSPLLRSQPVHLPVSPHHGIGQVEIMSGDLTDINPSRMLYPPLSPLAGSVASPLPRYPTASSPTSAYG